MPHTAVKTVESAAAQEDRSGAHMSGDTAGSEGGDLNWAGHYSLESLILMFVQVLLVLGVV